MYFKINLTVSHIQATATCDDEEMQENVYYPSKNTNEVGRKSKLGVKCDEREGKYDMAQCFLFSSVHDM